ncbi:MAG: hypothetical protein F4Y60_02790 [Boseongicola sp. SB0664_bin_43]|uniref:Uncharacterized protein n=1 Tax=Boseongicola sp. SB0664_bin_43 TaxID=2604844 RepID=A0A6B0XWF1_9RHOB|nr:hypothetical protein [Boseongicola sp. SB0664_bin_43]MYK30684.1 hypothetical protein [Boseongicola sp. SB0670_bin_30]
MRASSRQECRITDQRQASVNASFVHVLFFKMSIYAASIRLGHLARDTERVSATKVGGSIGADILNGSASEAA